MNNCWIGGKHKEEHSNHFKQTNLHITSELNVVNSSKIESKVLSKGNNSLSDILYTVIIHTEMIMHCHGTKNKLFTFNRHHGPQFTIQKVKLLFKVIFFFSAIKEVKSKKRKYHVHELLIFTAQLSFDDFCLFLLFILF